MFTLEEVQEKLKDRNLRAVARNSGVSYQKIRRVAKGKEKGYMYQTIKALSDYLKEQP